MHQKWYIQRELVGLTKKENKLAVELVGIEKRRLKAGVCGEKNTFINDIYI